MASSSFKRYFGCGVSIVLIVVGLAQITVFAKPAHFAQSTCPAIVQQAVNATGSACIRAGRDKLCYGNNSIHAEFQTGAGNVTFQAPGDLVDVSLVKQFTLGAMDTSANTWGMAEMKIKADLPDADPNQNVTLILFGNVQVSDAAPDANATAIALTPTVPTARATQTAAAIARQATQFAATSTKIAAILGIATARASTPSPTGTISARQATSSAATATQLTSLIETATAAPNGVRPTGGSQYGGMQAFYFQSGDTAPCEAAPHDGILIQSPQGGQRVTLSIDGAITSLGSTVFITAQPSRFLTINVLEGSAQVTAVGQTQTAGAGLAVQVPLDASLRAAGPPVPSKLYDSSTVQGLPVTILPQVVQILPAPAPGFIIRQWQVTKDAGITTDPACGNYALANKYVLSGTDPSGIFWWFNFGVGALILTKTGGETYIGQGSFASKSVSYNYTYTFNLVSPTHADGQLIVITSQAPICTITSTVHLDRLATFTPTP